MDSGEIPVESIAVSAPSSPGNVEVDVERQDPVTPTPIKKAWDALIGRVLFFIKAFLNIFIFSTVMLLFIIPLIPLATVAKKWKRVFILSCVAVSIDALFLYIPIIDQDDKCLGSDKGLRNVALVLRSLTDIAFIFHIIALMSNNMDEGPKWDDSKKDPAAASWLPRQLKLVREAIAKKMPWLNIHIIVNFLAILPIPQVAIIVGLSRLGGSKHFLKQTSINVFLVFQYLLRIFQTFLSIKKVGDTVGKLVKGSFYFLLYIIASHVLAAFWYFFSIQREISCWDQACRTIGGCMPSYDCGHNIPSNHISLNKFCPIDSANATIFDFGIFLDILQSGNTGSTNFSTKLFYSFWWGLRNLSNFGTNLETSSYIWENCFAVLICVIGLLLFLFLIGNVQTYIQSESEKFVKIRESRRTRINTKNREIEKWMLDHDIPDDMRTDIWKNIREDKVVEYINFDVSAEIMIRLCQYGSIDAKSDPLNFVCIQALKRIPILRKMDEQDLMVLCEYSRRKIDFKGKDRYITRAGQQLDAMYLIIDGVIECNDAETMNTQSMRRYYCCGDEIIRWAVLNYKRTDDHYDPLPFSTVDVKCLTTVSAFVLRTVGLTKVLNKLNSLEQLEAMARHSSTDQRIEEWLLRNGFPEDLKANIMNCLEENNLLVEENMYAEVDVDFLLGILPRDIKPSIKRHLGMNALKKVPMLQKMHEYVLEIICSYLQPVVYRKNNYIIRAGEPLSIMVFILQGTVIFTNTTASNATTSSSSEITEMCDENVIEIHSYYGEQLLRWASPNNISSSENPVISTRNVKCETKVEALILKAEDLRSVASRCGSQWNFNHCMNSQQLADDGKDRVSNTTTPTSPIEEEAIRLHQGHGIILEQLVLIRETIFRGLDDHGRKLDDQGRRLDDMATFLATVGYTGITSTSSTPSAP